MLFRSKGYTPAEIPVNYRSRSFKEGKKVSMLRDPLTWLAALLRLRLTKVDPMGEMERARMKRTTVASAQPSQLPAGSQVLSSPY